MRKSRVDFHGKKTKIFRAISKSLILTPAVLSSQIYHNILIKTILMIRPESSYKVATETFFPSILIQLISHWISRGEYGVIIFSKYQVNYTIIQKPVNSFALANQLIGFYPCVTFDLIWINFTQQCLKGALSGLR